MNCASLSLVPGTSSRYQDRSVPAYEWRFPSTLIEQTRQPRQCDCSECFQPTQQFMVRNPLVLLNDYKCECSECSPLPASTFTLLSAPPLSGANLAATSFPLLGSKISNGSNITKTNNPERSRSSSRVSYFPTTTSTVRYSPYNNTTVAKTPPSSPVPLVVSSRVSASPIVVVPSSASSVPTTGPFLPSTTRGSVADALWVSLALSELGQPTPSRLLLNAPKTSAASSLKSRASATTISSPVITHIT